MVSDEQPIGIILSRLIKEKGLSQSKLARLSGIDRGYINQLLHGKAHSITLKTATALAKGLDMPATVFLADGIKDYQPHQETPEDILERLRLAQPVSIPVFRDYPFHAGQPVDPVFYVYRSRPEVAGKNIEGYLVHGRCLEPIIQNDDIIIVDRERVIDDGDVIACLVPEGMLIARLRKIAGEVYLENNEGRIKFDECQAAAPVIEVIRRLK